MCYCDIKFIATVDKFIKIFQITLNVIIKLLFDLYSSHSSAFCCSAGIKLLNFDQADDRNIEKLFNLNRCQNRRLYCFLCPQVTKIHLSHAR